MKIVLLNPPFDQAAGFGSRRNLRRGNLPPLGLGSVAAEAEVRGHRVVLIDAPALRIDAEETAKRTTDLAPDLIGISVFTKTAAASYDLAHILKALRPQTPIVFGGPHVTSFYDTILQECVDVDFLVPGEGELVFADLADRIQAKACCVDQPGLIIRQPDGRGVATPQAKPVSDLDTLPQPAHHLFDDSLYLPLPNQSRRTPVATMMTSRGCPWARCAFCYQGGKYASPYRRRSPEHVMAEIVYLVEHKGIREILFWDDNFCVNPDWINRFCDLLNAQLFKISWTCMGRVNTVSLEMLRQIRTAGCYSIYFGLESGNQDLLNLICKGITLEQARRAVGWAKKAGLEVRGSFILGLPTETPAMAERTIRFACELNLDWMIFYPYHVQPGTKLEEIAMKHGYLAQESAAMNLPSYVPHGYESPDQLAALVRSAYRRYYLRPRYIIRALRRATNPLVLRNMILALIYSGGLMFAKKP